MKIATVVIDEPDGKYKHALDNLAQDKLEQSIPLCNCVRTAVQSYLERMGDHHIKDMYRFVLDEVERPLLESVLHHSGGNQTMAAHILGISRGTLRKKISQFGLMSANDPRIP